jgi:hypothetical protein
MSQIHLHIAECPQDFPTDDEKIFYVRLYLRRTAQEWLQPNIFAGGQVPSTLGWQLGALRSGACFEFQPARSLQRHVGILSMKPGDRLAIYQFEFNTHAIMTGYDEAALFQVFYRVRPSRIKDTMAQNQLPVSPARIKALASQLDQWYHRRNTERPNERAAVNPPPAGKSSGDSSGAAASGGGGSGKSKGKGKGGGKSNSLPKTNTPANTPANGNTAQASGYKQVKMYTAKLDSTGKLKLEERERRIKNNLCMFCSCAV